MLDISQWFGNHSQSLALAVRLLEGTRPGGGQAFFESLSVEGGVIAPSTVAFKVLVEWCHAKPAEAYGENLLKVLERGDVSPSAADNFAEHLMSESASQGGKLELLHVREIPYVVMF